MRSLPIFFLLIGSAHSQAESGGVVPKAITATFRSGTSITLRLGVGYVSAVHVPEPVSSIAVGDPAAFHAEHSDAEPELIFFKPVIAEPARSNAVIVTRNGTMLSLVLESQGRPAVGSEIDFLLDWRRAAGRLIAGSSEGALVRASAASNFDGAKEKQSQTDVLDEEIRHQADLSFSAEGQGELQVVVGRSRQIGKDMVVAFSARNRSNASIELLSPQMELTLEQRGKGRRLVSDPLPLLAYRMSRRRLEPGERSDGVVIFERPASKAAAAALQLRLARADQADRAVLLPVPFLATLSGDEHE